ncbi:MAG: sterol desaturase family protein [Planctomycetota bacterium]
MSSGEFAAAEPSEPRGPTDASGCDAEVVLRIGEGHISGALAGVLGVSAFGGALCFLFPHALTTVELRKSYDPALLRAVMFWFIVGASVFGAMNFLFAHGRRAAVVGLAAAAAAVLCGGANVPTSGADASRMAIGLDWLILGLLVSALIFIPIEKAIPHRRGQPILRRGWRTDLQHVVLTHLLVSYILLFTVHAAPMLFQWAVSETVRDTVRSCPHWLQFLLAVFCADMAQYWVHRLYHSRLLWRVHAIHHSAPLMDWLAGSRLHIVEILLTRASVLGALFLLGFEEPAVQAYIVLVGVQAVFVHANVGIRFGWLEYLLVTPRYHHWHHSDDRAAADTNFAVHLPLIDMMFGTFRLPAGQWPASYGVMGPPVPDGLLRQTLYPFASNEPLD